MGLLEKTKSLHVNFVKELYDSPSVISKERSSVKLLRSYKDISYETPEGESHSSLESKIVRIH